MTATARRDAVSRAAGGRQRRGRAILPSAVPCRARSASRRTAVRCRALRVCCPGLISTVSRVRSGSRMLSREPSARSHGHRCIMRSPIRAACVARVVPRRRVASDAPLSIYETSRYSTFTFLAPHPVAGAACSSSCFRSVRGGVGSGWAWGSRSSLRDSTFFVCRVCPVRAHTTPRSCGWCILRGQRSPFN